MEIAIIGIMIAATHLGPMNDGAHRTIATPGAYVVADNGLTAGAYRNTLGRTSLQLGYTSQVSGRWAWSAGVVTGYPGTKTGYASEPSSKYPLPYIAISYRFGEGAGARAIFMPQRTMPVAGAFELR